MILAFCKSLCEINSVEVIVSGLVGIITGLIASWIFAKTKESAKLKRLKKEFSPIAGKFVRWHLENKEKGNKKIHAIAEINYIGEKRLSIKVETLIDNQGIDYEKNEKQIWKGEIIMESQYYGNIVWRQLKPEKLKTNTGFKGFIISEDYNAVTIIGANDKGYGDEKFTERI